MALEISVRIKRSVFSEHIIEECIKAFWKNTSIKLKNIDENNVRFDNLYDTEGIIIYLIKKKKFPYNIFDSEIYKGEYEYSQILSFDINKNEDSNRVYNKIIEFVLYLYTKYRMEILVTTDFSDEICYFEKENIAYVNPQIAYVNRELFSKYNISIK